MEVLRLGWMQDPDDDPHGIEEAAQHPRHLLHLILVAAEKIGQHQDDHDLGNLRGLDQDDAGIEPARRAKQSGCPPPTGRQAG